MSEPKKKAKKKRKIISEARRAPRPKKDKPDTPGPKED